MYVCMYVCIYICIYIYTIIIFAYKGLIVILSRNNTLTDCK